MQLRMRLDLKDLLGATLATERQLSPDAWYVCTDAGAELVVKRVPRQERAQWTPGKPWAELVVLDLLAAEGGAVPPLVAADLNLGYLVLKFAPGKSFRSLPVSSGADVVASLGRSLRHIEMILEQEQTELTSFMVTPDVNDTERLLHGVERSLNSKAREAWRSLVEDAFRPKEPSETLGSLDVQPDNAILTDSGIILLDFATVGRQDRERRMVGYMHRAHPEPGTLLDDKGYESYASTFGTIAALRLVLYDFVYSLKVMELVMASERSHHPSHMQKAMALWGRPRLSDERVDRVRRAVPLSEGV